MRSLLNTSYSKIGLLLGLAVRYEALRSYRHSVKLTCCTSKLFKYIIMDVKHPFIFYSMCELFRY